MYSVAGVHISVLLFCYTAVCVGSREAKERETNTKQQEDGKDPRRTMMEIRLVNASSASTGVSNLEKVRSGSEYVPPAIPPRILNCNKESSESEKVERSRDLSR